MLNLRAVGPASPRALACADAHKLGLARTLVLPERLARRPVLAKRVAGEVEYPAAGLLVEAVGNDAIAFALAPGLQTELEPLSDALRAGRVSVAQPKLGGVTRRHDDERHVEAVFGRLDSVAIPGLKGAPLSYLPLLGLVEAGGEFQPFHSQSPYLPADAEVAHTFLVQQAKRDGDVGLALRGGFNIDGYLVPGVGAAGHIVFPDHCIAHKQLLEMVTRGCRSEVIPLTEAEPLALARQDRGRLAGLDKVTWLRRSAPRKAQLALHDRGCVIQNGPSLVDLVAVVRVSHYDAVNDLAIVLHEAAADFTEVHQRQEREPRVDALGPVLQIADHVWGI